MKEKEDLKEIAKEEIEKMEKVFKNLKIIENSEVIDLAKRYFEDAKYFFEKEDYIRAFEAIVISWSYVDACLHFKKVEIPKELQKYFTI
ncbi:MAG: DUF357 domain-containing protein [Candidatus Aenigmatarchaeota archaeon]